MEKYKHLDEFRNKLYRALKTITEPWEKEGPCGQGPFTGNTRESRQVKAIKIWFTPTRGGAPAVEIEIPDCFVEAWGLGKYLESELNAKIKAVNQEIEAL